MELEQQNQKDQQDADGRGSHDAAGHVGLRLIFSAVTDAVTRRQRERGDLRTRPGEESRRINALLKEAADGDGPHAIAAHDAAGSQAGVSAAICRSGPWRR